MRNRLAQFAELRRFLPLVAAALLLIALTLPMWRITLTAPQYPGRALPVDLYAYPRLGGEYQEVGLLNAYVGFHFPDPVFVEPNYEVHENAIAVPEWTFGPLVFVALAALSVFVALAPTARKLRLGLTSMLVGTIALFVGMLAIIQYRLHQAGHSLDPNAPMVGVDGFTPPLLGTYEVANISGTAWFGPGAYLTMIAIGLLVAAFLLRDSEATIRDTPTVTRTAIDRSRDLGRSVIRRARDGLGRSKRGESESEDGGSGRSRERTPRLRDAIARLRGSSSTRSADRRRPRGESR